MDWKAVKEKITSTRRSLGKAMMYLAALAIALYFVLSQIITNAFIEWIQIGDNGWKLLIAGFICLASSFGFIKMISRLDGSHPMEKVVNDLLDQSKKTLTDANKTLTDANDLLGPVAKRIFVQGSPKGNEIMDVVFEDYRSPPQRLDISFMGTAYGAFSLNNKQDSDYGFLHALKQHVKNCAAGGVNRALGEIKFVCGNDPLYSLSAKYLCLELLGEIKEHPGQEIGSLKVAYPYEDCIPATLIISSDRSAAKALIAPSIGKDDKDFLAKYYSIGFLIKDIKDDLPATNVIDRLRKPFDTHMKNKPEQWKLNRNSHTVEILNLHRIDFQECVSSAIVNLYKDEESVERSFFKELFQPESNDNTVISSTPFPISYGQIENVSGFIATCIKEMEKDRRK